jgi:DnaJ domain
MAPTYYEILAVAENATAEEIEAAFKSRAKEVHPDTVAPGNSYLKEVAAEAFKDLSEAKAVLLDPAERQKYDAQLARARRVKQSRTPLVEPGRSQAPAPRSQTDASAVPAPKRTVRRKLREPSGTRLGSLLCVVLGLGCLFFLGAAVWNGRTPPLGLSVSWIALALLSFSYGMRPNAKMSGGSALLLVLALVCAALFLVRWLPSMPAILTRGTAERVAPRVADAQAAKTPREAASRRASAPNPTILTVDESGEETGDSAVRIWKDLRDGQNYRTRLRGDTLSLESVGGNSRTVTSITRCEFHRAANPGPDWRGVCWERILKDQSTRPSSATVSAFSDTRLEGSTSDIPEFVMVPVENVQIGTPASPPSGVPPRPH